MKVFFIHVRIAAYYTEAEGERYDWVEWRWLEVFFFFFFPLLNQIGDELNTGAALYSTTAAFLSPRGDFLQGQQAVQYPAAQA